MNVKTDAAHSSKFKIIDLFVTVPAATAFLLNYFFPLKVDLHQTFKTFLTAAGAAAILAGLAVIISGKKEMKIHHQPVNTGIPTTSIVNSGIYSHTRNPLNLGAFILYSGIGIILKNIWFFILLPPSVFACTVYLIKPEEKYLQEKFGKVYLNYKRRVNRWFGRQDVH